MASFGAVPSEAGEGGFMLEDLLLFGGVVLFCAFIAYERMCNRL